MSPEEVHKDDQREVWSTFLVKRPRVGIVQSGKEKASGRV